MPSGWFSNHAGKKSHVVISGEWADSDRSNIKLQDYAAYWITQRAGLRPRTVDLYTWLCGKHINPYLGGVPLGRLTTPMIREWRAKLLRGGISVSIAAKAYRLLRSILATAVEEDKILARNPCRIRGAGTERAPERPVLTVAQVFELAELVGRRPIGNIRRLPDGRYQLRYRRHGPTHTAPEVYLTRQAAETDLWARGKDGRADYDHDRRYRALVLLATFASLRWGEATALRRCDLDLAAGTGAPLPLGVDEQGREVLSFVPGDVPRNPLPPETAGEDVLVARPG
jgi:integrase